MSCHRHLREFLVCPITHQPLVYDREHDVLISLSSKRVYPIRNGIPIMLWDEGENLDTWQERKP